MTKEARERNDKDVARREGLTEFDYLIATLGEECGEVQQVVGKILRFGPQNDYPKYNNLANMIVLMHEVHDIVAVYEMALIEYQKTYGVCFPISLDQDRLEKKKLKVEKYMEYSKRVNRLR
jgi:hypothetical protein